MSYIVRGSHPFAKGAKGWGSPVKKQIEEFTDVYSFLFWQLGVKP